MRHPLHHLLRDSLQAAACATVLLGTLAFAQQPEPPAAPAPPPSAPGQPPRPKMDRDVRSRSDRSESMRSGFRMGPPGMWWKNPDLVQKLALTADQQKRMDDIFQQSRLQLIDLKANLEKQEVTLEPMLDANPPDTNKILAQIDKTAQARAELEKGNARMLLGIRNILTPDQWTKLQAAQLESRGAMMRKGSRAPGGSGEPGGPGGPSFRSPSSFHRNGDQGPDGMLLPPLPSGHPQPEPEPDPALAELSAQ
jgi:Spy/CpxP family protein refolding chaperone